MPPYHYRWQRSATPGGTSFVDIPGAADAAYWSFTPTDGTYNNYAFQCIVTDTNGDSVTTVPATITIIVPNAPDDAQVVAFLAIPTLVPGTNNYGSVVTFRNVGYNAWTSTGGYHLSSQSPAGNFTWGFNTVTLNPGEIVLPGGTRDFLLPLKAPNASGSFGCFWQLEHNSQFFGPVAGQTVNVGTTNPLAAVPNVIPVNGQINLQADSSINSVTFTLSSNAEAAASARIDGTMSAAPGTQVASMTLPANQPWDLSSLHLTPGGYMLEVVVTYSEGIQSAPMQKAITLVSADLNAMRVYPNPWRADQDAGVPITFDNLSLSSTVKIFTVSGTAGSGRCRLPMIKSPGI